MTRSLAFCIALVASTSLFAADPENIVYDFSAVWCGPCQQMAPIVARLKREGLPIRKVDIDHEKELAKRFNITSLPTFVVVINGKETHRQSGAMTETSLRRMITQVKSAPKPLIAQTSGPLNVDLGSSVPMTGSEANAPENLAATQPPKPESSPFKKFLPFGSKSTETPSVVRGNDSETSGAASPQSSADTNLSANPMDSSVRIRVIIDKKINLGSGTIIQSQEGISRILTCAHIFRGFNEDSKIEVDLVINNKPQVHIAHLDSFNEEADLGLISVATTKPLPVAAIAKADHAPHKGEPVVGIGCSGGDPPTREQLHVTDIDKYLGPHNIECTGLPVQGRSGGGLFNKDGEVVGVCIAADKEQQRGLYSGFLAVHSILDKAELAFLYKEPQADVAAIAATEPPQAPSWPPASEVMPTHHHSQPPASVAAVTPSHNTPVSKPVNLKTGTAEVVVIIRDPAHPEQENRVVIIHQASSKFLSYLDGELDGSAARNPRMISHHVPLQPVNRSLRLAASLQSPVPSAALRARRDSKSSLQQTSLSQPVVPRRYVRTSRSSADVSRGL